MQEKIFGVVYNEIETWNIMQVKKLELAKTKRIGKCAMKEKLEILCK